MKKKILLTGAGGRLGSYLREPLSKICNTLISTDIKELLGHMEQTEEAKSSKPSPTYVSLDNFRMGWKKAKAKAKTSSNPDGPARLQRIQSYCI